MIEHPPRSGEVSPFANEKMRANHALRRALIALNTRITTHEDAAAEAVATSANITAAKAKELIGALLTKLYNYRSALEKDGVISPSTLKVYIRAFQQAKKIEKNLPSEEKRSAEVVNLKRPEKH